MLVVGGPLDGEIVTLHAECSRLGFFVHEVPDDDDPEATWWWGYYAHETRDGFRIFRPGRAKGQGHDHPR